MKFIFLRVFIYIIVLIYSECFSQQAIENNRNPYITIRVIDESGRPLEDAEVTIIGKLEAPGLKTDSHGEVFIEMEKYGIRVGQVLLIEVMLEGYCMIDGIYHYTVKDPAIEPNFITIVLRKCDEPPCRLISLNEYIKKHSKFLIGLGFGYQKGDDLTISDLPREIRTVPPHSDDVVNRPNDILDPNIPDNYLLIENTVDVALKHRISLDVHVRFWGILNIAIQVSQMKGSEVTEGENYYRKSYIKEGSPGGDALIYYLVRSKERSFFDGNSFSLPIYVTCPVFYCGKNKEIIFHLVGGTNLLLPDKISFEAEKGWHRFNGREIETTFDLGELKQMKFFGGIGIEGAPTNSIRFGIQFLLVYTEYQEDFKFPLSLKQSNKVLPSIRLNLTKLFRSK